MLEALLLGDVTIPASVNFADEYKRLQQPQGLSKKGFIVQQYEVDMPFKIASKISKVPIVIHSTVVVLDVRSFYVVCCAFCLDS